MKSLSKANKMIVSMISAFCAIALVVGLTFCFINLTPKKEENIQTSQAKTQPDNTSYYWDEAHDAGLVTLDFDWAGSGTEEDPWLISSAEELAGLAYTIYNNTKPEYLTSSYYYSGNYFKQTADIDVSKFWWTTIGGGYYKEDSEIYRPFSGNYNGDGHTVSGIFTPSSSDYRYSNRGLFGQAEGQSISKQIIICNVGITDSFVQGSDYIGGIIGTASYVLVVNCYNTGNVSGSDDIGGIVGYSVAGSTIANCYNIGSISASTRAGGIAGYNEKLIINCFNAGSVSGAVNYIGGIAGQSFAGISKCYYGGNCTLSKGVGNGTDTATKITNLNSDTYAKGKAWYTNSANWDSLYPWDFDRVWEFRSGENDGYPVFKGPPTWIDFAASSFGGGDGSASNPYKIASAEQLAKLAKDVNNSIEYSGVYFEQTANIDLGDYNWIPIGDNPNYAFKGIYNGAFYSINNINSVEIGSNDKSGGLFGYVNNAKLMNIIMVDGSVEGGRDTGAICGENDGDSSIKNCIVENISISMKYGNASVGGIVGRFTGGTVESCIVKNCVISSGGTVGGICGWRSTVKDCAVINCIINKGWSNTCDTALGWGENSTTVSSFAVATCDGTAKKIMYGNTSAWGNWGLAPSVNNDYPIQNSLFALGGFSTSQEVYNKLIALGFICN